MDFTQTNQKQMEDLYSKHQLNQCIKQAFLDDGYAEEMTHYTYRVWYAGEESYVGSSKFTPNAQMYQRGFFESSPPERGLCSMK